jgi:membrane dipeptidase
MIFDLHCDAIWKIDLAREKNEKISLAKSALQIDEEKLVKGGYFAQCFAIYIPNKFLNPYERCLNAIDLYYEELKNCVNLSPVYEFSDFVKNNSAGKISSILTMEDGCPIGNDIKKLHHLYKLGVRMICLTHNLVNAIGFPNYGKYLSDGRPDYVTPNTKTGLTDFGKQLVQEMNRLGVIVDVSHLSDKGFYDVIEISKKPIMASHSNARAMCGSIRNLTDNMLKKLADNGGVMGINYAKGFLNDDKEKGANTIECMVEHIKYIRNKIGVEHIALGSDFDGIDTDIELKDASMMPLVIQALEKNQFNIDEIEKITYKNAVRVFKECIN